MKLRTTLTLVITACLPLFLFAQETAPSIYTINDVSLKPVFAKGKMSEAEFLKLYKKYPEDAGEKGNEGTVILSFVVAADGEVTQPGIVQSAGESLDAEAVRLVSLIPYYTPGYKDGEPVATRLYFAVPFENTQAATIPAVLKSETAPVLSDTVVSPIYEERMSTLSPDEVARLKARIRTDKSLENNQPMFILDGNPLNENIDLDANTIESIRVMKGKKAMQFYGANGKNGVVIITTKNFPDSQTSK